MRKHFNLLNVYEGFSSTLPQTFNKCSTSKQMVLWHLEWHWSLKEYMGSLIYWKCYIQLLNAVHQCKESTLEQCGSTPLQFMNLIYMFRQYTFHKLRRDLCLIREWMKSFVWTGLAFVSLLNFKDSLFTKVPENWDLKLWTNFMDSSFFVRQCEPFGAPLSRSILSMSSVSFLSVWDAFKSLLRITSAKCLI